MDMKRELIDLPGDTSEIFIKPRLKKLSSNNLNSFHVKETE